MQKNKKKGIQIYGTKCYKAQNESKYIGKTLQQRIFSFRERVGALLCAVGVRASATVCEPLVVEGDDFVHVDDDWMPAIDDSRANAGAAALYKRSKRQQTEHQRRICGTALVEPNKRRQ